MNIFNNKELSWLLFNERVLQEAQDKTVPLLQRLRFLGIFSNNQDEFFKVRMATLLRLHDMPGTKHEVLTGGYTPAELIHELYEKITILQSRFTVAYTEIRAEMEQNGIFLIDHTQLNEEQRQFCTNYFMTIISVRLVPLMVRKHIEIPFLADGKIYLAVKMNIKTTTRYAIIEVPISEASPRFVVLPSSQGRTEVIFVDDIIKLFLDNIFFMFNYDSIQAYTFKFTRDAVFTLDDDVSKSFMEKMSDGISQRQHGRVIRMTYDMEMPDDVLKLLAHKFKLKKPQQLVASGRYHLMRDLMKFPKVNSALENDKQNALVHKAIDPFSSIISVIKQHDILLYYPYHAFNHFIDLLREAAIDPSVESIFITLYRTASHSKVINALRNAAKNGKKVTVLVELKARFDEEQNIANANELQESGVKVLYSLESIKVHSKVALIERKEGGGKLKGYAYIGTGNFNENTATLYCDFGLFTANQKVVADARKLFDYLEHTHKRHEYDCLLVAPYDLRSAINKILQIEIEQAKKGKKAYFYGKFNSLTDEKIIEKLYKASNAGVKIRLIIRGACCLKPQIEGLSENIEIHSIVDGYLEHARMIIHANGGKEKSYILSADLMTRNLDRRVEVGAPIMDKHIHKTLRDIFNLQWSDNVKARLLTDDKENTYYQGKTDEKIRSQKDIYTYFMTKNNS
ncbi:MAG: polyphosphate kinase 1 [Bacteroidales bacterium]|jgi:polyphosphate kinase|nr:polyphosphate kinase 1 [Bacteroidales bacterium]